MLTTTSSCIHFTKNINPNQSAIELQEETKNEFRYLVRQRDLRYIKKKKTNYESTIIDQFSFTEMRNMCSTINIIDRKNIFSIGKKMHASYTPPMTCIYKY